MFAKLIIRQDHHITTKERFALKLKIVEFLIFFKRKSFWFK